ncbi:MAG TPA: GAF domain-containing sensor histidine kinase [Anaerolineae bacterium]|nr:GAF domain-containing sensor histidine kinase [Anaerolineae bacterium]
MTQRRRTVVSIAGVLAILAVLVVHTLRFPPGRESLAPGLLFGLLVVFTTTFGIPLAGGRGSLLPTTTVTAYLVMGSVPTAWVAFLGALVHGAIRYCCPDRLDERLVPGFLAAARLASANAVLQTSSVLVAGVVYRAMGGTTPFAGTTWKSIVPVAGLAVSYLAMNLVMAALYFGTFSRERLKTYARSLHRVLLYEGSPLIFAPIMALTYTYLGLVPFVTMMLAIVLVSLGVRSLGLAQQRLERRVQELKGLQAVGQALNGSLDLDTILAAIHVQVGRLMDAENFYVALYDAETGEVTFPLAFEEGKRVRWRARRAGNGLTEHVLHTQAPLLIRQDVQAQISALGIDSIGRPPASWLGVPLLAAGQALGVISVQSFSSLQSYDLSHQEVLAMIAAQASLAIENAGLYARTDAALTHRLQELNSILRTVHEGVLLFDNRYRVLMANRALADFVGVAQLELLGHSLHETLADGSLSLLSLFDYTLSDLEDDCRLLAAENILFKRDEISLRPADRLVERTLTPVYDREDQISGWLLVLRDLTEERELAQWREEMTGLLVHDLRSPLSVIVSGLELIEMELASGHEQGAASVLGLARQSSQQVMRLVNDLLDVSRLESGKMAVSSGPVDVEPLLEGIAARLGPLAAPAGIVLRVEVEPGLPCLWVDSYVVDRVMHNLADNALKFTPNGGRVCLWARRGPERGDGSSLLLGVTDTGPGIPADVQARIFQKFQQLDPAEGRRRGAGLGLYFCKLAVEAQGGQVWVESGVGQGSTFVVRLPAAAGAPR